MAQLDQNRLVAKEVALGVVRESALLPEDHIGLRSIAPFQSVESDDVIFDYVQGLVTGLAPARAEDSESELSQKDETVGTGRAAIIDWAIKDHYDPSDISRFREAFLLGQTAGVENFPLTVRNMRDGFQQRLDRDTLVRRRKLDNRLEWLVMQALETGHVAYNDSKIIFDVDFQRPTVQTNASVTVTWDSNSADPIHNWVDVIDYMWDTYRVRMGTVIVSDKIVRNVLNSDKFAARSGLAVVGGPSAGEIDPRYIIDGWGIEAAMAVLQRATGLNVVRYNSVYRTRPLGSTTPVNHPFLDETKCIFLPQISDVNAFDDTIGFAKTLTSPHPEGNWTSGFYEWEKDTGPDPWGYDRGNGIKAFPVFPHLELSYVLKVLE